MMKFLITGFNPFNHEKINPAIEVVKMLPDQIQGAKLIKLEIPTEFKKSQDLIKKAIIENQPDYVINVGQAGGRFAITPERVAINLADSKVKDNAGEQFINQPIHPDGKTAYFTQLPIKAMVKAIRQVGIPSEISNSAGTYVCNSLFYHVQYLREKNFPNLKAGFIHVPFLPQQIVNRSHIPAISQIDMVTGLTAALNAVIERDGLEDIK